MSTERNPHEMSNEEYVEYLKSRESPIVSDSTPQGHRGEEQEKPAAPGEEFWAPALAHLRRVVIIGVLTGIALVGLVVLFVLLLVDENDVEREPSFEEASSQGKEVSLEAEGLVKEVAIPPSWSSDEEPRRYIYESPNSTYALYSRDYTVARYSVNEGKAWFEALPLVREGESEASCEEALDGARLSCEVVVNKYDEEGNIAYDEGSSSLRFEYRFYGSEARGVISLEGYSRR